MYKESWKLCFITFQILGGKYLKQGHFCECEMNTILIQTVYYPELSTHKIHNFFCNQKPNFYSQREKDSNIPGKTTIFLFMTTTGLSHCPYK